MRARAVARVVVAWWSRRGGLASHHLPLSGACAQSSFSVLDKLLALGTIGCSLYTLHDSYEAKGLDRQVKAAIGTLAGATIAALSFWYKAARKGGKAYDHAMWHVALFYAQVVLCVIAVECNGASAMTFVNRCVLPAFEIPAFEMPAFAFEMPTFGSSGAPEVTEAVPPEVIEDPPTPMDYD